MSDYELQAALDKMRGDGVAEIAVDTFAHYFERLRAGDTGVLAEAEIEPVAELPDAAELPADEAGARAALDRTVVIKLNGGLGTSMGMTAPKSLLEVKDGLTFLDVTVRQILDLRARTGAQLPLVEQFEVGERRLNLLAQGRVVNLAAAEGHPAAVMDMSFANQALCVEHLAREGAALAARVLPVPPEIDREVARLKLASLAVRIDELTPAQREYLTSWRS